MSRTEEVELTNMCMICDGKGNVLVQNKKNHPTWHGWNFPGGHVEKGEYVMPSVIREMESVKYTIHRMGIRYSVKFITAMPAHRGKTHNLSPQCPVPQSRLTAYTIIARKILLQQIKRRRSHAQDRFMEFYR